MSLQKAVPSSADVSIFSSEDSSFKDAILAFPSALFEARRFAKCLWYCVVRRQTWRPRSLSFAVVLSTAIVCPLTLWAGVARCATFFVMDLIRSDVWSWSDGSRVVAVRTQKSIIVKLCFKKLLLCVELLWVFSREEPRFFVLSTFCRLAV